ncbi:Ycf66 family protein [Lusitaniella coriacea]|uniref:Ycf66 family protein n=1 Tax=Lusitaniella coriacea TaxID=1983105 RepID=UPI003CF93896
MLAYILAIAVGLGSFAFLMAAFFFTEVHRKIDFLWSGVGLFYALVLWICAGRMTGGVLLGQTAAVSLIVALGWQLLTLRRAKTPSAEQTEISPEVEEKVKGFTPASIFSPVTKLFRKPKPTSTPAEPVQSVATLVEPEMATEVKPADVKEETAEFPVTETFGAEEEAIAESDSPEMTESPAIETFGTEEEAIAESDSPEMTESPAIETFGTENEVIAESDSPEIAESPTIETLGAEEEIEAENTITELPESEEDKTSASPEEIEESIPEGVAEDTTHSSPNPPKPPAADLLEASQEDKKQGSSQGTPVEEFAPEVELAPFAEPPEMNDAVPNGKDEEN